jgi:uncharacterized protein with HEPN domain
MNERAAERLRDAQDASNHITEFIAGNTFRDYEGDYGLRLQIERLLEIVGEAMSRTRGEWSM